MDSILKAFSIPFLLRSVFGGIFFVVSYYVAFYGLEATVMKIEAKSISSPVLLVALFAGVAVYGVHRSLVYPFIEFFLIPKLGKVCADGSRKLCEDGSHSHSSATTPYRRYFGGGITEQRKEGGIAKKSIND